MRCTVCVRVCVCARFTTRCSPMSLWIYSMRARVSVFERNAIVAEMRKKGGSTLLATIDFWFSTQQYRIYRKFHSFSLSSFCSSVRETLHKTTSPWIYALLCTIFFFFVSLFFFSLLSFSEVRGFRTKTLFRLTQCQSHILCHFISDCEANRTMKMHRSHKPLHGFTVKMCTLLLSTRGGFLNSRFRLFFSLLLRVRAFALYLMKLWSLGIAVRAASITTLFTIQNMCKIWME